MKKTFNKKEIKSIAKEIIALVSQKKSESDATVVTLSGDLGAGKTTLTQAIARELGIEENVVSPTFVIMKNYRLKTKDYRLLVHIDTYRLDSSAELLKLGWAEIISDPKNLVLIEWPERVADILPENCISIVLSHHTEEERNVNIK